MNKSLTRVLAFFALAGILTVPYFNCGPNNQSLFGSGGDKDCVDPSKPDKCYGDPNLLFLIQSNMQPQYPISTANGAFNISLPCSDGGFPLVTVSYRLTTPNLFEMAKGTVECISGIAQIYGQITTSDMAAWTAGVVYMFEFKILAYQSRSATIPLPINTAGTQPVLRPAFKSNQ